MNEPDCASASAFDGMAQEYDAQFTATALGSRLRATTWRHFERVFAQREYPARDRLRHRRRRHASRQPRASRASPRTRRADAARGEAQGRARRLRAPHPFPVPADGAARRELAGEKFDGVWSNFGAINCAASLPALARNLAPLVPAGRAAGVGGHGTPRSLGMGLVSGARRSSARLSAPAPRRRRLARPDHALSDARRSWRARCGPTSRPHAARRSASFCRRVTPRTGSIARRAR